MATLKISDISVGDWVRVINQFDAQIDGYHSESGSLSLKTRQRHLVHYRLEDIHSIPITPEILEANGLFRHEFDADNPKRVVMSNSCMLARTYEDVDWWRVLIYDEEELSAELFNGIVYYVHQLQHALRLAGVEKEIVMPKKMKDTTYMKLKELWLAKQKLYRELRRPKLYQLVQSTIGSIVMPKK